MRDDRIQMLRYFMETIEKAPDADGTLQAVADASAELLGADKVSVVARTPSGLLQVKALHWPASDGTDGIAAQVLNSGEPLLVVDYENDTRLTGRRTERYRTSSFLCVPIMTAGSTTAVLNVTDRADGSKFGEADLELAELLCRIAGLNLERHRFQERIELLQRESVTDALTGLGNRRHFEQRLASEMGRSRRFSHPLSLIMLDIDDFKFYNDTLGHPAGDAALRSVSEGLLENVRSIDDVVRYGGEEFAVVLPQTPIDLATVVAERIRSAMNKLPINGSDQLPRGHFSVSVGVASYPRDSRDDTELINHADIALYMAKSEGKDRVVAFEPLKEDERRTYRRIPIRLNTVIEPADGTDLFEEHGVIQNISAGGALITHRRELDLEVPLHLSIHSPFTNGGNNPIVFRVNGRLVRLEREKDGFGSAIAFDEELKRFS